MTAALAISLVIFVLGAISAAVSDHPSREFTFSAGMIFSGVIALFLSAVAAIVGAFL